MTIRQIENLLKDSTFQYLKTGSNYEEVLYYAKLLIQAKEGNEMLQVCRNPPCSGCCAL